MPPKPKFNREQLLAEAFALLRAEGEQALTARRLAEALGTSTRPIFTLFGGMEELKEALVPLAEQELRRSFEGFKEYAPAFKQFGIDLVSFASREPHLFAFLFMSRRQRPRTVTEWAGGALVDEVIEIIQRDYGLDKETAIVLFKEVWLHAYSLCVLRVCGAALLTDQEVSASLSRSFWGMIELIKAGRHTYEGVVPSKGGELPCFK